MPKCEPPISAKATEADTDMLHIEAINTYYGDSHILRGVDVDMPAATSVGLLGRNGMG